MDHSSIQIDSKTWVTEKIIVFKGVEYKVADVKNLYMSESKQSLNFVTTNRQIYLGIRFIDGQHILISGMGVLFRPAKFDSIRGAFGLLSLLTLRQRYDIYKGLLNKIGNYSGI